ncbi:unnamed protein product [Durusdinium trenchii]|uniref:Uncharacterized protein n=1 Tax=Durusdinium trenchii TaxID=1381693 RepID=A0ABP0MCA2_9DINO
MMLPLCPVWNGKAGDAGLDAGAHLSLACASHLCCPAERAVPKSVIRSAPCSKSWASLEGQRVAAGPVELPQPSHLHDLHAPLAFEGPPEGAPEGEDWKETGADGFTVSEGADHVAAKRT